MSKYQEETNKFINKWEEKSREFIHNFLENFGNSRNKIQDRVRRAISPSPLGTRASNSDIGLQTFNFYLTIRAFLLL